MKCPVCHSSRGWTSGEPFKSAWAVSCHIAACAKSGDRTHRRWLNPYIDDFFNKSMSTVAHELLGEVRGLLEGTSSSSRQDSSVIPRMSPYEVIASVERGLHRVIREALEDEYGNEPEDKWWREGVPLDVRKTCAQRREEDDQPRHQFHYVDLIDFRTLIDRQWRILEPSLQSARGSFRGKRDWLDGILRLNQIRRKVMHPVRGDISEDEHAVLDTFHEALQSLPSAAADSVPESDEAEQIPEWKRKLMELIGENDD